MSSLLGLHSDQQGIFMSHSAPLPKGSVKGEDALNDIVCSKLVVRALG